MKRIKNFSTLLILAILLMISFDVFSQQKRADTIAIKTSAVCGQCKDRIEGGLAFEKGVKSSDLDLETGIVKVVYNPVKTTPDKIREAISQLGYDADAVPADMKAYGKLPACCKKDAPKH